MKFKISMMLCSFMLLLLLSCSQDGQQTSSKVDEVADMILMNGNIHTVDENQPKAQAIAIKGDRILMVGSDDDVKALINDSTEVIDLSGKFVMPGFIEGHGHFSGLGSSLLNLNFLKSKNWEEIVSMVEGRVDEIEPGEWVTGRGWHQEKWDTPLSRQVLGYPYHDDLSAISPDNPVVLRHASGHSLFANAKAMELAGITAETPDPAGGEIVRDSRGQAIGVFEETAMSLITSHYNDYVATLTEEERKKQWLDGIDMAEKECLENGITSFQDAGSGFNEIDWYEELATTGELDIRLWVMISGRDPQLKIKASNFPKIGVGKNFLTVRAIKGYMDGALGAFGAWMLHPYDDKPNSYGKNTTPIDTLRTWANVAWDNGLQYCVHAIGDRGNREVLNIFEEQIMKDSASDHRWRVEHAQHIDTADIPRFKQRGIIASMQGIHCTSDAPFVVKRLGFMRAKLGAYPWRSLLDAGVVIANGTDAPVEDVSPIESYYASVTRKRA
ncbi:MAG: amidohydrolase, partial [Bacteroidota bacterium]